MSCIYGTLYSVKCTHPGLDIYCTVYSVHTLYVYSTLYSVHILYVYSTLYSLHILYVYSTVYSVHTLCAYRKVYSVHTQYMYIVQLGLGQFCIKCLFIFQLSGPGLVETIPWQSHG